MIMGNSRIDIEEYLARVPRKEDKKISSRNVLCSYTFRIRVDSALKSKGGVRLVFIVAVNVCDIVKKTGSLSKRL